MKKNRLPLTERIANKKLEDGLQSDHTSRVSTTRIAQSSGVLNAVNRKSSLNRANQISIPMQFSGAIGERKFRPASDGLRKQNRINNEMPQQATFTQNMTRQSPPNTILGTRQATINQETRQFQSSLGTHTRQDLPPTSDRHAQRATKLMVEPFHFLNFTEWSCTQTFNEHGCLRITGLIAEENRMAYPDMMTKQTWACAKAEDEGGKEIILFQGVLTHLAIQSQHQFHTMTIEIKTGSFLLDQIPHTRTFHPDTTTYQSMIETCLEPANGEFIMREKIAEQTHQFTVSYRESEWKFIQRLAHRLGVVVLPETRTKGKRLLLGLNPKDRAEEIIADHYTMTRSPNDPDSLIRTEQGMYQIQTRDIYELGQAVHFQGRRLIISKIKSRLEGSELIHHYTLCSLKPAYDRRQPYEQIKGIAMRARVINVARDQVQVSIHEDENNGQSGTRWFDYATVYSTPDGTGWFAQPEIGDEVRVLFPTADEADAYVASNVHLETRGGRTNPDHKSWKNKQQKEILFTPDSLTFTNNQGLSVELSDQKGIIINSNLGIFLQSDGQIQLNSQNAGITAYGDRNLTLKQGAASIHIQDDIDISGGKINMN